MSSHSEQQEPFTPSQDTESAATAPEGPSETTNKTSSVPESNRPPPPPPGLPPFNDKRPTAAFDGEEFASETSTPEAAPDDFDALAPETTNADLPPQDKPDPFAEVALVYDAQQLSLVRNFGAFLTYTYFMPCYQQCCLIYPKRTVHCCSDQIDYIFYTSSPKTRPRNSEFVCL